MITISIWETRTRTRREGLPEYFIKASLNEWNVMFTDSPKKLFSGMTILRKF